MHRAPAAGATGLFMVADMARLARVTQGKRFFTLWNASPWAESACGMKSRKSGKFGKCSSLWNI
jgi:hypothetical protein